MSEKQVGRAFADWLSLVRLPLLSSAETGAKPLAEK